MNTPELRSSLVKWLSSENYTYAVTLKPNNPRIEVTDYYLRRNLNRFHRDLDRQLLGTRFCDERNGLRRTRVFAVLEGLPFNGHIHGAVRIAPELRERFEMIVSPGNRRNPWVKSVPGGTIHVDTITTADGWFEYATKRFATRDFSDNVILLP
jgi:hypothetical protein